MTNAKERKPESAKTLAIAGAPKRQAEKTQQRRGSGDASSSKDASKNSRNV